MSTSLLGMAVATGAIGYAALAAHTNGDPALSHSSRMVFRDGRRFQITLHRAAGFPIAASEFKAIRCVYTSDTGTQSVWHFDAASFLRHADPNHATFSFWARGLSRGGIHITVDDDEVGPISVEPTTADPCASSGPIGPKSAR